MGLLSQNIGSVLYENKGYIFMLRTTKEIKQDNSDY